MTILHQLSDSSLRQTLKNLATSERAGLVALVDHLAEVDSRSLDKEWGYSSLWDYVTRELLMKDGVAYNRIALARLVRKRPEIRPLLVDGSLGQCSAVLLNEFVASEHFSELLLRATKSSKRELQDYIAIYRGKPTPKKDTIRRVAETVAKLAPVQASVATPQPPLTALPLRPLPLEAQVNKPVHTPALSLFQSPIAAPVIAAVTQHSEKSEAKPLFDEAEVKTHRISFMATEAMVDKLKRAKDLAGTQELGAVLEAALNAFLEKKDPVKRQERRVARKAKAAPQPVEVKVSGNEKSEDINSRRQAGDESEKSNPRRQPIGVRDEVTVRDGGRCTYVGPDGVRCGATRYLEIDHVLAWSKGGSSRQVENATLHCKNHNLLKARKEFGTKVPRKPGIANAFDS